MEGRIRRLRAYVAEGARTPFIWGQSDCCPWASGWVLAETGLDPLAYIRGAYCSRLSCERFLRGHGGLEALARRSMHAFGFRQAERLAAGDVGLIPTAVGPMGAIRCDDSWALKTLDGVAFVNAAPIVAWRI